MCVCGSGWSERERERERTNRISNKGGEIELYPQLTVFVDSNVAWLQVTMNDPSRVNILQVKTRPVLSFSFSLHNVMFL